MKNNFTTTTIIKSKEQKVRTIQTSTEVLQCDQFIIIYIADVVEWIVDSGGIAYLHCLNVLFTTEDILTVYIYIRLKIKPNSVRIRSLSCQMFVLPSTGFELTPLIHCTTNA
jgi:hypothetical protein